MYNVTMWCLRTTIVAKEKQQFVLHVWLGYMSLSTVQNNFSALLLLTPLPYKLNNVFPMHC
jgi:hypothetical protein